MNLSDPPSAERASLGDRLRRRIRDKGPLTFRDWMAAALYDPQAGYYCRSDIQRWGRAGDYRTSPERSPLFAATFARYFNSLFEEMGRPSRWTIVECGAGSGDFANGVLETLSLVYPAAFTATDYVIDEVSVGSLVVLAEKLSRFADKIRFVRLQDLAPIVQGVIFSNELLDAFPIHRVTVCEGKLRELYVALDQTGEFVWTSGVTSDPRLAEYFEFVGAQPCEGQIADVNLEIEGWLTTVSAKLNTGYIVTVDYGDEAERLFGAPERREGTLRAFRNHQLVVDVLARPGDQDLTSTVDWTYVRRVGERLGFATIEYKAQDKFLLSEGLLEELARLVAVSANEAERLRLSTSAREMILPNGMAASFQVLVQKSGGSG